MHFVRFYGICTILPFYARAYASGTPYITKTPVCRHHSTWCAWGQAPKMGRKLLIIRSRCQFEQSQYLMFRFSATETVGLPFRQLCCHFPGRFQQPFWKVPVGLPFKSRMHYHPLKKHILHIDILRLTYQC